MFEDRIDCVLDAKATLGECPTWSTEERCLYWIDIEGRTFNRFTPQTQSNRQWRLPETPGSFVLAAPRRIVIALQSGLYEFDPDSGSRSKLIDAPYDLSRLRFNDGRTDRQGRYWLGSMLTDSLAEGDEGSYYCYDGSRLTQTIAQIHHANGTAFSPDGKTMYRAETMQRKIFAYELDVKTGELSNERLFAAVPDSLGLPDGATVDTEGGYWSALPAGPRGGSVARFKPDGQLDFVIEMPVLLPLMPAFGGPEMKTLYVTSGMVEHLIGKQPSAHSGALFSVDTSFSGIAETTLAAR